MGNLIVRPSYVPTETDIITPDKLALMATPQVSLALESPVNDQNYFRNGNFYSSFWTTPAGIVCPVGVETQNADYWTVNPNGAQVTYLRSNDVPDLFSLYSLQIIGSPNVTDCSLGQQINGDLSAVLRRQCTVSAIIQNNSGAVMSPTFEIWTANAFNNFSNVTLQTTVDLQTCASGAWTYVTATVDLSTLTNVANGLFLKFRLPTGSLSATAKTLNFSRLKLQIGEVATEFVDDASLLIQQPSVDSTALQDGAIARPGQFLPNVIPAGAYQANSINNGDINDGAVDGRCLSATAVTDSLGYTPINKAGDTAIGPGALQFNNDDVVGNNAYLGAGIVLQSTPSYQANDGYMPAISFNRPSVCARAIGLAIDGRLRTIDAAGVSGYMLDSVYKVDTASYQDNSITLGKLAQSLIDILIPAGMIRMFGGPTIPPGWLACDGTAVSRTTYAALYAAIGTYWGVGDNISTFNLPDFRGRGPLGYVNSAVTGVTSRAFAALGGEEYHALSVTELAAHAHGVTDNGHGHPGTVDTGHTHGVNDPGHNHTAICAPVNASLTGSGANIAANYGATSTSVTNVKVAAASANINVAVGKTGIGIQNNGGSVGHNNMAPFAVCYFIIKT